MCRVGRAGTARPTVFHGAESDVELGEVGHRQALAAAGWFRELRPTAVVSSAMRRARDTAGPIAAACGVPHLIEPELHERAVGPLAGTAFSMEAGAWPETVARWAAGDTAYTTPGAESFDALAARLLPAFRRVVAAHPGGRVVVVAHGVVCKVLMLSLLPGWGVADWVRFGRVANLSVSELRVDGATWAAGELLVVPPPVAALTGGEVTGTGTKSQG